MFTIGKILKPHGIRGDVRVLPMTDDPRRFELLNPVKIFDKSLSQLLTIEKVWYHKQFVMLKFIGINDMTAAETLRGAEIKIDDSEALPLGKDEYYIRDLLGLCVVTDSDETLGELSDVLQTGANDVYVVKNKDGDEILIPAIAQCVLGVDMKTRAMTVHLLEGLR